MDRRPLAAVLTLGCKLNLADSEEIARGLAGAGYAVVDRLCEADAVVVNTCSVTHVADQKSRRLIRAARRLSPGARVAVTGCFPQSAGIERALELGADLVVGTRDRDKEELVAFLAPAEPLAERPPESGALHTRAFIKAQEGCNDVCAFCIVPRTRGREESRPVAVVVREARAAVESGAREIVITGTQLGAWGRDLESRRRPEDLIAGLLAECEAPRIRFSSLQPQDITPGLLALWEDPRLMPHFHLALQSGSDEVLRLMRRRYTATEYREAAARIRAAVPGVAITTDIIAGFPEETGEEFDETLAFSEEMRFSRIHAFPFSRRNGTTAARLGEQLRPEVIRERMGRLLALGARLNLDFRRALAGEVRPVLWEGERTVGARTLWRGHTDSYVPVYAPGKNLNNRVTPVMIGAVYHDGVAGSPLEGRE